MEDVYKRQAVFRVLGKKGVELVQIPGQVVVLPDGQLGDLPAQGTDLVIVQAGFVVMVQKLSLIHL